MSSKRRQSIWSLCLRPGREYLASHPRSLAWGRQGPGRTSMDPSRHRVAARPRRRRDSGAHPPAGSEPVAVAVAVVVVDDARAVHTAVWRWRSVRTTAVAADSYEPAAREHAQSDARMPLERRTKTRRCCRFRLPSHRVCAPLRRQAFFHLLLLL